MGYTNYWYQYRNFTDMEWARIKDQFKYVSQTMPNLYIHNDGDALMLNGTGDDAHETFVLTKKRYRDDQLTKEQMTHPYTFHFCKTNGKPYDLAVWYLLTWIEHECTGGATLDNAIEISRDRLEGKYFFDQKGDDAQNAIQDFTGTMESY